MLIDLNFFFFLYPLTVSKYIVALALPIDIPNKNTFMSYNFEANYVLPSQSTDFTQGFYDKILLVDGVDQNLEPDEIVENESDARELEGFVSRRNVYRMIEQKMEAYGLNGTACLTRIICEVADSNLIDTNGIIGHLIHILFT